ncbi:MAG: hypothetical protein GY850_03400 [bacterium]|nr:hypothetical protein [bacterium]
MDAAVGILEVKLRKAADPAIRKIDSDGRLAMTSVICKVFVENPSEFDSQNT